MAQSLVQIYAHIVYSTKERKPFLSNVELFAATSTTRQSLSAESGTMFIPCAD